MTASTRRCSSPSAGRPSVDAGGVDDDGLLGDVQPAGDGGVAEAFGDEGEHLATPGAQRVERLVVAQAPFHHQLTDLGVEDGAALGDAAQVAAERGDVEDALLSR